MTFSSELDLYPNLDRAVQEARASSPAILRRGGRAAQAAASVRMREDAAARRGL
jgi:hypothetical protein